MTIKWLLAWWNLVFLVPLALALAYLAIYCVTGAMFDGADADADTEVDTDVDPDVGADADIDADAEVDADADVDANVDADADSDPDPVGHHSSSAARNALGALAWVGVGRVPLSLVLMVLMLTWGFIGFVTNQFLRDEVSRQWLIPLVSLPVAAVVSLLATRLLARGMSRLMPTEETYARRRKDLLGEVGEAIYPIDERFGMAAVRDDRGNLYQVPCRVESGRLPIAKGEKVLLVSYEANRNIFHVMPDEGGAFVRAARGGLTKGGLS
jgi:hypothetical protein